MNGKPASIYDIAKAAGVNPSTVSRALNNTDRIGAETREKIFRIANELGYQPSAIARSLTTRRTQTIGVVAPFLSDPFLGKVIDGIEERADDYDYRVLFSTSRRDQDRELTIARNFQRYNVDAVIIVTTHLRTTYQLFAKTLKVPVVLVGQDDPDCDIAVVTVDDVAAITSATRYLLDLGHREFAWIGVADRTFSNAKRRDTLLTVVEAALPGCDVFTVCGSIGTDLEQGRAALPLVRARGATAVLCYNDMVAFGLVSAAAQAGVSVPEEISVIGYDDLDISAFLPPPLTTIRQPLDELGRSAVDIVLDLLRGARRRRTVLHGELIIRQTTGVPRK